MFSYENESIYGAICVKNAVILEDEAKRPHDNYKV